MIDDDLLDLVARLTEQRQRQVDGHEPDGDDVDLAPISAARAAGLAVARRLPRGRPAERAAWADVLGAVVDGSDDPPDAALDLLLPALATETEPLVLAAIAEALARACDERARPALLDLARHPDGRVRLVAVQALPSTNAGERGDDVDPAVVAALVAATRDPEPRIRDWATFGLGALEATGPGVADALLARTGDDDQEVRAEALFALAHRRDERVVAPLLAGLAAPNVGRLLIRAAGRLADPRLHAALLALADELEPDDPATADATDERWWQQLAAATRRCDPAAPAAAEQAEGELLAGLLGTMLETGLGTVDATLAGEYPTTEVVVTIGTNEVRAPIWDFDEDDPADPFTYDEAFTRYRLANLARRL